MLPLRFFVVYRIFMMKRHVLPRGASCCVVSVVRGVQRAALRPRWPWLFRRSRGRW
jgi:hypothetical protein